jgi:hypothetical protein
MWTGLNRNEYQGSFWGVKDGRRLRLTTSPQSVSRFPRKCESLDISQSYRSALPLTGIALPFYLRTELSTFTRTFNSRPVVIDGGFWPKASGVGSGNEIPIEARGVSTCLLPSDYCACKSCDRKALSRRCKESNCFAIHCETEEINGLDP